MDISKCKGEDCPLKDKCYRYTVISTDRWQSYLMNPPYREEKGKTVCDLFIKDRRNEKKRT